MTLLPVVCDLNVLSAGERSRRQALQDELMPAVLEVRELEDGYAMRLPGGPESIGAARELMALEKRCCPFLSLELQLNEDGSAWLRLTGGGGVKAFLEAELAPR